MIHFTPTQPPEDAALTMLLAQEPDEATSVRFATASAQLLAMIEGGEFMCCGAGTMTMLHGFAMWLKMESERAEAAESAATEATHSRRRERRWIARTIDVWGWYWRGR